MPSVARSTISDQIRSRILHQRPYHPWWLMPLAEFLTQSGYGTSARNRIVDGVDDGLFLSSLVVEGSMDSADLIGAEAALESGRAWRSSRTLTVEPFMPDPDEPDPFDEVLELDAVFDEADAAREYHPTPEDWEDYRRWSEGEDFAAALRAQSDALNIYLTLFPN